MNSKKIVAVLLLFGGWLCQFEASAQAENSLMATLSCAGHLNKLNLRNDAMYPAALSTRNTLGFSIGVAYQRLTHKNIILYTDLQFGRKKHDIGIFIDLAKFDPDSDVLRGQSLNDRIVTRVNYLQLRLMGGRRFFAKRSFPIDVFGGAGAKLYLNPNFERSSMIVSYSSNDGSVLHKRQAYLVINALTSDPTGTGSGKGTTFAEGTTTLEFYVGTMKVIKRSFIKELRLGLEYAQILPITKDAGRSLSVTSFNVKSPPYSSDDYVDRNVTIGLRLSARLF